MIPQLDWIAGANAFQEMMTRAQHVNNRRNWQSFGVMRWPDNDLTPGLFPVVSSIDYRRLPQTPTNEDILEIAFALTHAIESPKLLHNELVRHYEARSSGGIVQVLADQKQWGWGVSVLVLD